MITIREISSRGRELLGVSAPVIVEQTGVTAMGMVSAWLVNSVGLHAVTAVGMVDSVSSLVISLFSALMTGATIIAAQYIGARDTENARRVAGQAVMLSAAFSAAVAVVMLFLRKPLLRGLFGGAEADVLAAADLFFLITLASYPFMSVFQTAFGILRGCGDTRTPMFISIGMNIVNISLGFLLIGRLGVLGVATALVSARLMGFLAACLCLYRNERTRLTGLRYFKPNKSLRNKILRIGIPTSVESTLFNLGKLISMTYIVGMGTEAAAANSIGMTISGLMGVPGSAMCVAVMIIIGQRVGGGRADDVKTAALFSVAAASVMMGVMCLFCAIFNDSIVGLYDFPPGAADTLKRLLRMSYIATPLFWAVGSVTPAALRAAGDVRYTMVIAIASMWLIRIVLGYVLGVMLGFGIAGVWIAMFGDWVFKGVLYISRVISGKWRGKGLV